MPTYNQTYPRLETILRGTAPKSGLGSITSYLTYEQLVSELREARKYYASAVEQESFPQVKLRLERLAITANALAQNLRKSEDGKEVYFSFNDVPNKCKKEYLVKLQAFAGGSSKKKVAADGLSGSYLKQYRTKGSLAGMSEKCMKDNIETVLNHIKLQVKGDERARYTLVIKYKEGTGYISCQRKGR